MNHAFIFLMIFLFLHLSLDGVRVHGVSLCFGADVSQDKLELPPQSEEGTSTPGAGEDVQPIQPQAGGTMTQPEQAAATTTGTAVGSRQSAGDSQTEGTEAVVAGSSTLHPQTLPSTEAVAAGSPTLSSQAATTGTTSEPVPAIAGTSSETTGSTTTAVPSATTTETASGSRQSAGDSRQEGAEAVVAGSSTLHPQTLPSTETVAAGSPTLSGQAVTTGTASEPAPAITGTDTTATATTGTSSETPGSPTTTVPSGIWGKIGSWMTAFSGMPTITGSPSITGLMLMPTAYRLDKQRKLNIDFVFSYYLGELWNKTTYKESRVEKVDIFNPINRLSCSGDFKYSLILEKKWMPAAALGYQGFIVLQGNASSAGAMGGAVSDKSDSFGYTYCVLSKRFKNIGVHIGSQSGPIGKFINPLSNKLNVTSNSALIAGLDTTICKRTAFVELIYPQEKGCMMINTFIDNFLPFNFTYIKFNNKLSNNTLTGYSVTGYFKARTTGFPGEKKGKKK